MKHTLKRAKTKRVRLPHVYHVIGHLVEEADIMVMSITELFEHQYRYQYTAKICFYTNQAN